MRRNDYEDIIKTYIEKLRALSESIWNESKVQSLSKDMLFSRVVVAFELKHDLEGLFLKRTDLALIEGGAKTEEGRVPDSWANGKMAYFF